MVEHSVDEQGDMPARRESSSWHRSSSAVLLVVAAVAALVLVAALHPEVPQHGWLVSVLSFASIFADTLRGQGSRSALLEAVGSVGPGTHLQLQTAQGPMQLTVDSQMNAGGYVHAFGFMKGQEYAGYVKLSAANPAAQQVLSQAPSYGQQQLTQYPTASPYTEQAMYAQPQAVYAQPQPQPQGSQPLQLHISPDGSVSLNGEQVSAADGRTAAVLRLLSKQAEAQGGQRAEARRSMSLAQQISHARERLQQLEEEKGMPHKSVRGERGRSEERREHEPRAAMWAAMKTLMHSVDRIEQKQDSMQHTVEKVKKIMRYSPFH